MSRALISHSPDRTSALVQVAVAFSAAPPDRVADLQETLVTLSKARRTAEGRFVAGRSVNLRGLADLRLA
jgi:hypothetical protein